MSCTAGWRRPWTPARTWPWSSRRSSSRAADHPPLGGGGEERGRGLVGQLSARPGPAGCRCPSRKLAVQEPVEAGAVAQVDGALRTAPGDAAFDQLVGLLRDVERALDVPGRVDGGDAGPLH